MIAILIRVLAALLALVALACGGQAEFWGQARLACPRQAPVRFTTVDVYVDAGDVSLAAWQVEFAAETGDVTVVGIEGGAHPAFRHAPYYDAKALAGGRVIVAAYSTQRELPGGRTRVARLHLRVAGLTKPEYVARLQAASNRAGQRIDHDAKVTLEQGE